MRHPQNTAADSWDEYLAENPTTRVETQEATTDATRLNGYIVETLSDRSRTKARSVKTYRRRLVRASDGVVIIDTRKFYTKMISENIMKKAIDAQYGLDRRRRESTEANECKHGEH